MSIAVLAATAVGCVLDVALPDAPPPIFHADCSAMPAALAHIDGLEGPTMLLDLEYLVVVSSEEGDPTRKKLWLVPLRDGPPTLIASGLDPVAGVALDGSWVIVTMNHDDGGAAGEVLIVPFDGKSAPIHLASHRQATGAVTSLGNFVYWAEEGHDSSGQPFGAIMKARPFDDAGVTTLQRMDIDQVPRQFREFEWEPADGEFVEWLYWTTGDPAHPAPGRGEVHGCAVPTPFSPVVRADDSDGGGAGSIDEESFTTSDGYIEKLLYSGPQGITALTVEPDGGHADARDFVPTGGFAGRITTDASGTVYFVDPSTGALMAQAIHHTGPAAARRLATGLDPATTLRVDDACVYCIDTRAGNVMMTHR